MHTQAVAHLNEFSIICTTSLDRLICPHRGSLVKQKHPPDTHFFVRIKRKYGAVGLFNFYDRRKRGGKNIKKNNSKDKTRIYA